LKGEVTNKITPYKKGDLFIYIFTATVVFVLFAVFVIFPVKAEPLGFVVAKNGKDVLTFSFEGGHEFYNGGESFITVVDDGNGIWTITVRDAEHTDEYNVIKADCVQKTVKVTEANCSVSADCTFSPEIKNGVGAIICEPHRLVIRPLSGGYTPVTVG